MGKKKSCQEVIVPRPLDATETRLYGWVEKAVLTQQSVVENDALSEFRRSYPLMEDSGAKGDYMLEAAGPSDRVPFRADEDGPHFLWVYRELFTRLRMRLPFSDFQRDVMTRCRVAVSQLHLNGWGFILSFEKVCLHFGFRPTIRLFFYIYDVHFPPGGYGYVSFRARQGRRLFDSYEESIQEFKWHYFKVLAAPGNHWRWLPSSSLSLFRVVCRRGTSSLVGLFLTAPTPKLESSLIKNYGLLDVKMRRTKLDDLMAKMADPARMGPRPILPTSSPSVTATAAAAAAASASASAAGAAAGSPHLESSIQVPPGPTASDAKKAKKQPAKRDRSKLKVDEAFEKALGDDSAWEHEVDPLKVAFPENFDYRKALNAGLTSAPVREALTKMPPEQLLEESYHLHAKWVWKLPWWRRLRRRRNSRLPLTKLRS
ncbi:hypothetical protein PIB30_007896 [Stylosanthes scabra]|uniref:Transposase (putative) gypsy type domain-containing protein n=1 Tax=Stylosanthes scabra TaxID=79078 RepID=A0ABU6R557_9FABA|nr:hypothetical protein [Stylosanthes scabra]